MNIGGCLFTCVRLGFKPSQGFQATRIARPNHTPSLLHAACRVKMALLIHGIVAMVLNIGMWRQPGPSRALVATVQACLDIRDQDAITCCSLSVILSQLVIRERLPSLFTATQSIHFGPAAQP